LGQPVMLKFSLLTPIVAIRLSVGKDRLINALTTL